MLGDSVLIIKCYQIRIFAMSLWQQQPDDDEDEDDDGDEL